MIQIRRLLPGELEGNVNPEDYGFDVIDDLPPSDDEADRRVGELYARAKERTGIVIPALEPYLQMIKSMTTVPRPPGRRSGGRRRRGDDRRR
ncbi:hypothetical protein AB0M54_39085 [Actinoplanes sp. NPDC051470]|uniref:hypothetical protein n=1 Tax=Actinoplanes sp. NPDC051470 TaxID=3157224 RepID=UPI0034291D09